MPTKAIQTCLGKLEEKGYNMHKLAADSVRVFGPAAVGYFMGMGAEAAAMAACGPGLGPTLAGGIARTHVPAIYQLDIHRPFINWLIKKCGLNEEERGALLSAKNESCNNINHQVNINSQPQAQTVRPETIKQEIAADRETSTSCIVTVCENLATRGVPSVMTGFAISALPATFGMDVASGAGEIFMKGLQACAPSFFGCLSSQRDERDAKRHDSELETDIQKASTMTRS